MHAFLVAPSVSPRAAWHRTRTTCPLPHPRPRAAGARRARTPHTPRMSGVNGGIDYEIDLSALPEPLAARIAYIQGGPDSPVELIAAAEAIAAAAPTYPQTLPVLVDVLGFNNPVAANIAVAALATAGEAAIAPLLTGVAAFNYAVNAYALRALARIGDPAVRDVAAACAARGPIPNVRRAACRALGALRFESAADADDAFLCLLRLADTEPDWGVRYAAVVALQGFVALELVGPALRRDAVAVVAATAEGRSRVSTELQPAEGEGEGEGEGEVATPPAELVVDPAVMARATVALESLAPRVEALV